MNLRFIDWIWHVRGSVALERGHGDDVFARLDCLFHQPGTSYERTGDTLTFRKQDQAAQDKMSIFDGGVLRVEPGAAGPMLRYHLTSRALLFCFLAPLLFLGIAQFTIYLAKTPKPAVAAAGPHAKTGHTPPKPLVKPKPKKPPAKPEVQMNPIDKALGAPAPEKPGKNSGDDDGGRDKKPSPTPAYVFAAIFATLYVVGRILEDRLVKALFKRTLRGTVNEAAYSDAI